MGVLPASLLALIYTLSIANQAIAQSSSPGYTFEYEIAKFIPRCAQWCFTVFVDDNFPKSICSVSPTLDCLCAHNTTSGFTIGEASAQCIIMENNVGFCAGDSGSSQISDKAYNMCRGKPNAFPNTHATLSASLFIETASQSIAQVTSTPASKPVVTSSTASVITSSGTSAPTTSAPTTSAPTTSASSKPASSKPASTTSPPTTSETASTSASASTSATVLASAQDSSAPATGETHLSSPQVAGIVVASVGAASLAIGAIAIAACMRRRRKKARERDHDNKRDSYLRPFQLDPSRGRGDFNNGQIKRNYGSPGPTRNGVAKKIGPRVPPRECTDPNMFSRRSLRPDQIGVAASPERENLARCSRLLPEKPILRLHVPPEPVARRVPLPKSFPMSQNKETNNEPAESNRDSTMTRFEEDNAPYTPYDFGANANDDRFYNDAMVSQATAVPISTSYAVGKVPPPSMGGRSYDDAMVSQATAVPISSSYAVGKVPPPSMGARPYNDAMVSQATAVPISTSYAMGKVPPPRMDARQDATKLLKIQKPSQGFSQPLQPGTATSSIYLGRGPLPDGTAGYKDGWWQPQRPVQQRSPYKPYTPYQQQASERQRNEIVRDFDNQGKWSPGPTLVPAPLRRKSNINDRQSIELSPVAESPVSYPKIPKPSPIMTYPPRQPDFQRNRGHHRQQQQRPPQQQPYVAPWLQAEKDAARMRNQAKQARSENNTWSSSILTQMSPQTQLPPRTSSVMSTKSSSSSLLEKRRGKEQAANLILVSAQYEATRRREQPKWHVLKDRTQFPKTPSWSPELTPKMRNGELYLTVQ